MYLIFIRSILVNASEVWDNCGRISTERLVRDNLKLRVLFTGLPSFSNIQSIYTETGWEKLKTRREIKKLTLFYKIIEATSKV